MRRNNSGFRITGFDAILKPPSRATRRASFFGFDPVAEAIPRNIPEDCDCGAVNERGRRRCRKCRRPLAARSRYEVWYQALTSMYFCERYGLQLPVRYADVMSLLPTLRPYPSPRSRCYRDAIYAVTHIVYTLNDYNSTRLAAPLLAARARVSQGKPAMGDQAGRGRYCRRDRRQPRGLRPRRHGSPDGQRTSVLTRTAARRWRLGR